MGKPGILGLNDRMGLFLLLLALGLPAVFAQAPGPAYLSAGFVPNWWPLALIGLAVGVGYVALLFMLGEAGNFTGLKSMARAEMYELGFTVVILVAIAGSLLAYGIFAQNVVGSHLISNTASGSGAAGTQYVGYCDENKNLYPVSGTIDPGLPPASKKALEQRAAQEPENLLFADVDWFLGCQPSPAAGALVQDTLHQVRIGGVELISSAKYEDTYYVQQQAGAAWQNLQTEGVGKSKGVMSTQLMDIYVSLFSLEFMLGPISTFGVSAFLPEGTLSVIPFDLAPNAGLTPVSEATIMLIDLIGVGLGSIVMQKVLLQFIHQNALAVLLPLGMGFRGIPFLRKTGSTIIAVALVMYFIFPMSIWINQQVYFALNSNPDHPVMQKWSQYQDALALCQPLPGESAQAFKQRIEEQLAKPVDAQDKGVMQSVLDFIFKSQDSKERVIVGKNADGTPIYGDTQLPASAQNALIEGSRTNLGVVFGYVLNPAWLLGPALPTQYFFDALVDQISNGMQWFALNLLFLVNTLLLSVTLFRDISLALGGEPRIFGMSKLV